MLPLIEASLISGGLRLQGRPISSIHSIAERDCLENPSAYYSGVPRVGTMGREASLPPLCAAKNTLSRSVQLFSKQSQKGYSRKPGFRHTAFSETLRYKERAGAWKLRPRGHPTGYIAPIRLLVGR